MAVAAYASLVSLTHVLDNLHYRAPFHLPRLDMKQIEMLQATVGSLLEFVECHSERESVELEGLWRQMAEVAFKTEETIDFHVVNQLHMTSEGETTGTGLSDFGEDMETMIQNICNIKKELPEIQGENVPAGNLPSAAVPTVGSSAASSGGKNAVVGIDEHVVRVMDELTKGGSDLQILPITGMGGIGKTTLATSVFDHPYVVNYFHKRIWLTISQEYSVEQILKDLQDEVKDLDLQDEEEKKVPPPASLDELKVRLYKKLFGIRYLIVMDDVWTTQVWDDFKTIFPNKPTGSRILLTTRLSDLAGCFSSHNPYRLSFLDDNQSWDLLCQNAFAQKGCPHVDLEKIGKDIAKSCRGLPLEIVVIGRKLANSNMTREYWESVARDISSLGNLEDDEHCLKVLSLSYKTLPIHLKPCFLYMRTFREDDEINISHLMSKWIAEGFIKLARDKSLEETAADVVKALIDRNMLFRRSREACGIHDLLRDLCLRESVIERFIRSPKVQCTVSRSIRGICFLCSEPNTAGKGKHLPKTVHIIASSSQDSPLLCGACHKMYSQITRPRLVKVMDGRHDGSWKEIVLPTEVRYASLILDFKFVSPSKVHLLWNLQNLFIYHLGSTSIVLPCEIWEMPQLRHIRVQGVLLPDPTAGHVEGEDTLVLKNLETLAKVLNFQCTKNIVDRIPNLKTLEIFYKDISGYGINWSNYSLCNIAQLQKLESLYIQDASDHITFPKSLKQLSLMNCQMAWENMSVLGSLSSLERLELCGGVEGSEWNPVEEEFLRLKDLLIESTNLVRWTADQNHFPILERLELSRLLLLEEIPLDIGDIATLQSIRVNRCNGSVINSAKRIWEEQESMENDSLQIDVTDEYGRQYKLGNFESQ